MFKKTSSLFAGVIIAGCIISIPAFAKANWSSPSQVSFQNSNQVHITVDPNGKAFGIWQSFDGNSDVIQSSTLQQTGSWTEPVTLSDLGQNVMSPSIAADAFGNAISIWSQFDGNHFIIHSATLSPNGQWSQAIPLSAAGENALYPVLASSTIGQGTTVAAWSRYNGTNDVVQTSFHSKSGKWTPAVDLSLPGIDGVVSEVAINPRSHAIATFSNLKFGEENVVAHASFFNGISWQLGTLPDGANDDTSVAIDRNGNAVCVWSKFDLPTNRIVLYASFLRAGKTWSSPRLLSDPSQNALNPVVRMNDNGDTVVLWMGSEESDDSSIYAYASTSKFNQWSKPVKLSAENQKISEIDLAVGRLGNAVAIWATYSDTDTSLIQSASMNQKGRWNKVENISLADKRVGSPVVSVDRAGNAVALWLEADPAVDGTDARVWGATLPCGN